MRYDDLVRTVAGATNLTRKRADDLTVATLTVLAEALTPDETRDLLAQLPKTLRARIPVGSEPLAMRPIEFAARVAELVGGVSVEDASAQVRAVFDTLGQAVNAGEMRDVFAQLGDEYADMLGFTAHASPSPAADEEPNVDADAGDTDAGEKVAAVGTLVAEAARTSAEHAARTAAAGVRSVAGVAGHIAETGVRVAVSAAAKAAEAVPRPARR